MTISRHYVSLRTYALAFAVALSPALLQDTTCSPATGDATLSALEVEVMGDNYISAFDSAQRAYDVLLPLGADTAIVRAYSTDPDSQVSYNLSTNNYAGTLDTIDYGYFPTGGGEVTLNGLLPEGRSLLGIHVRAPGGRRALYTIAIQVGCNDCDDGNECTEDVCSPANGVCEHPAVPDWTPCAEGRGGCFGGLCNFVPVSVAVGEKEVVFDWTTDRCEDLDLPDSPAHIIRAEDGELVLFASNGPTNHVSRGPDFDTLQRVCDPPALVSADLRTPETYENWEWIWSTYREGTNWHALILNEFHDTFAPTCKPGDPSPANLCTYWSITHAVSTDGAHSFVKPNPPAHVVAPPPRVWEPPVTPATVWLKEGYAATSSIVRGSDDYYYTLIGLYESKNAPHRQCLMRTDTLDDPASWRAWDGNGFTLRMESPYVTGDQVPPCVALWTKPGGPGLVYNTYLDLYMAVGLGGGPCGVYMWLSPDLIHWGSAQLIAQARHSDCDPGPTPGLLESVPIIFPTIIDHADSTANFERPGRTPHLYYTRFNAGLDRDLVRVPLKFTLGGPLCEGVDCDDQNVCTQDLCNGADGSCEHTPIDCADANECTVDTCNPAVGCEYAAVADGTPCGGGFGACQGGSCTAQFPCTEQGINDAIAAGGGTHTFDCATPTTVVTTAEVVIGNDVILDGEGKLTVDGGGDHRVFSVAAGVNAELIGFTMTGGFTAEAGGGVLNAGTLTLVNSVVLGNTARFGGGIRNDGQAHVLDTTVSNNFATQAAGGISNRPGATMTLTRTTVQGNVATGDVGGIGNTGATLTLNDTTVSGNQAGGEAGGIRNTDGTLTVSNSTVSGNTAGGPGGGFLNRTGATLMLTGTTVSSNSSGADGGGILNEGTLIITGSTVAANTGATSGGGIENISGSIAIDSSTISGNTTMAGGGGAIENPFPEGTLSLTNTTVSGNSSIGRGAIENAGSAVVIASTLSLNVADGTFLWDGTGLVTIRNTILDGSCKVLPVVDSLGGNVESEGNTCGLDQPTDQVWLPAPELNLQPLGDNGGSTQTHALGPGSDAIDWIEAAECVDAAGLPLTTDQRDLPRPAGPRCDVGAFEVQP